MDHLITCNENNAIQNAIDTAAANGGGRVVLMPGTYLSGTIYLKNNVELHLEAGAVLLGHPTPELYDDFNDLPHFDFAPENSRKCLIAAKNCRNIAITGYGEINGQGPAFYDTNVPPGNFFNKPPHPRPRLIQLYNCQNVFIENVSVIDSPGWSVLLTKCDNVKINGVTVAGCQQMINNDGIDLDGCSRVHISDCTIRTGDDCIVVRALRHNQEEAAICEHITVTNCTLDSHCQGIRIGCPSDDTIRHCVFSNLTISGRCNGIYCESPVRYLSSNCTGYLNVHDILFDNIDIDCAGYPIRLICEDGIILRAFKRFTFSNIRIRSGYAVELRGNAGTPIEDIVLDNVTGTVENDTPLFLKYVKHLKMNNVDLTGCTGEITPLVRGESTSWEAAR